MGAAVLCSSCCFVLSSWAVVQLVLMGIFYKMEAASLIEDVEPSNGGYTDFDDFIRISKINYAATAHNCWIAAAIYMLTLIMSWVAIYLAKKKEKLEEMRIKDDEYSCLPEEEKKLRKKQ